MILTLFLSLMFLAQTEQGTLSRDNERQIERVEDRVDTMQRQLDRMERTVEQIVIGTDTTKILIYVVMAFLGIDKGSYWVRERLNGRNKKQVS